jgi:hypothetical protein
MVQFLAIDTETQAEDGKPVVLPFNVKRFLDLIGGKQMIRMPRFYCGVCSVCFGKTYYQGQNHGTRLDVVSQ